MLIKNMYHVVTYFVILCIILACESHSLSERYSITNIFVPTIPVRYSARAGYAVNDNLSRAMLP